MFKSPSQVITKVFYRRGLIEEMGMGTQKIVQLCTEAGLKEPEFFEQAGTFVVRLWSRHYSDDGAIKERSELTDKEKSIIKALGDTQLSLAEIFEQLNAEIPRRTLSRHLNILKEKGYIDYEGPQGKNRKWYTIK